MKQIFIAACLFCVISVSAQVKKAPVSKPRPTTAQPAATSKLPKNLKDSVSYALGVIMGSQGFTNLNTSLFDMAIKDVAGKKKTLFTAEEANKVIMSYMSKVQESKAKVNIDAGKAFLSANKKRAGVKETASGLQYEVVRAGDGPKPSETDKVTVNYMGTLLNGQEFDNSYKRGEPATFPLNGVIAGWTEGLQLMPVGSKYKLYIPYQLGYGVSGNGTIPPGSLLIFEVELLKIADK